mmetsp:Transcript_475/g.872  ORF Transcript_475/g.872 Transcript_475/m.872 type:complete len:519 (-) Transcript_475:184-1740(-)
MQVDNCEASLANLPIVTEDMYFDGNSQGCRALHSVFAAVNSKHCAHLSLDPKNDTDGKIKCQQSKGILPEDLFDEDDFASFANFQVELGIDPTIGYKETGVTIADDVCSRQENYLRDQSLSFDDREKLEELYDADIFEYSTDPNRVNRFRSLLCGGNGTRNFVSLGKVIIGDYDQAIRLLSSEKQTRGSYVGPFRMREDRVNKFITIVLSDGDVHTNVRRSIINYIFLPAQVRVNSDDALVGDVLKQYVNDFVDDVSLTGRNSPNLKLSRQTIDTFVCRWIMKALLDIEVDDTILDLMKYLSLRPGSYFAYMMEPSATKITSDEQAKEIKHALDRFALIVQNSTPLLAYDPPHGNFNMTKNEFSQLFSEIICFYVPLLGVLIQNLFEYIPVDHSIDHTDPIEVEAAVLESLRINPPLGEVNTILSRETMLNVGGENKTFPPGTAVASSLALASWDENVFADPLVFNHTRFNLRSHMVSFAYQGHDPSTMPRRSCPGKNIAMKLGVDVLTALLEKEEGE